MRKDSRIFFSGKGRMKLSGTRKEEYETVWLPLRRGRKIDAEAFRAVVKRLERAEKKAIEAAERAERAYAIRRARQLEAERLARIEAERVAKERKKAEDERKKQIARQKRIEKENRRIRALVVGEIPIRADTDSDAVIELIGRIPRRDQLRVLLYRGGDAIVDTVIHFEYTRKRFGGEHDAGGLYWKYFKDILTREGSPPVFLWDEWGDTVGRLVIAVPDAVEAVRLRQAFADGPVHCAVTPLLRVWEKLVEGDVAVETKKRYMRICSKLREYAVRYPDGVPEGEEMEELAHIAMHRIGIVDIFGAEYLEYNKGAKRRFYYRNVRENHLEEGGTVVGGVCELVTCEEFERLKEEHEERRIRGEFYMLEGKGCLRSGRGAWRVENKLHDMFDRFSRESGVISYSIDSCRYPDVASFLRAGCIVNSAPVVFSNEWDGHIDMKNAYIQHAASSYFEGFLSHIWTWRKLHGVDTGTFLRDHLGMYSFKVLECSGWVSRLGLTVGEEYILPSPEIRYMLDHGCKVELLAGCFGGRFDLKYSAELLVPFEDVKKPYAHWAGCQGSYNPCKSYSFYGTGAWASHLRSLGYDVWFHDGLIRVEIPKKVVPVRHHILAFITSYCRINMLLALEKFSVDSVSAVVMDGIYFRGDAPVVSDIFREKKAGEILNSGCAWYSPCCVSIDWKDIGDPALLSSCMLVGAGGSGKTESILREKESFNNILYVVPCRALGSAKYEEHGVRWTTIHKLIGMECVAFREENVEPAVVLLDELTMIEASWIRKARLMYPQTMFLICGDIDEKMAYQCRSGDGKTFSEVFLGDGLPFVRFLNDYRAQDSTLKELKIAIREQMKLIYTDGGVADAKKIRDWVRLECDVVSFSTACSMFREGDTWIAGTHRTNAELLKRGIASGSCITGSRSREIVKGWEVRGSFSTHSFQGSTIDTGKIFVSIDDAFEIAMIYTALSRARRFSQLVFVSGGCGYGVL